MMLVTKWIKVVRSFIQLIYSKIEGLLYALV
jgi:hypothetical protein